MDRKIRPISQQRQPLHNLIPEEDFNLVCNIAHQDSILASKIYNRKQIYKLGYSIYKNSPVYCFGLGFGGNIAISEKQKISVDLSNNQIGYNNNWDNGKLNILTRPILIINTAFPKNFQY